MKTKPSDGAAAPVAAIDWIAPAIKPSSEWSTPGNASDVLRRGVDFHYRMPLWLAMPVAEAEKLRVTRIAMALTTTTTEASVASGGAVAADALDDGTYVRVVRDGATEALTVTTVTGSVSHVDVYGAMPLRAAPFWTIALAIVALSMMTGCSVRFTPAGEVEEAKASPELLRVDRTTNVVWTGPVFSTELPTEPRWETNVHARLIVRVGTNSYSIPAEVLR